VDLRDVCVVMVLLLEQQGACMKVVWPGDLVASAALQTGMAFLLLLLLRSPWLAPQLHSSFQMVRRRRPAVVSATFFLGFVGLHV
jgi:hypothetical protein